MDELHVDTFGMLRIDDLPSSSATATSQSRTFGSFNNRQENETESPETKRSALELAVRGTQAARLSLLSSEKEDDVRRITLMQNSEDGEKLVEEPHIVDESWRCYRTTYCRRNYRSCNYRSCNYDRNDNSAHRTSYDANFDRNCRSFCTCRSCEGRSCLQPSRNIYDDDDDYVIIVIKFEHILALVKLGLALVTDWAKRIYLWASMAVGLGQYRDDDVD